MTASPSLRELFTVEQHTHVGTLVAEVQRIRTSGYAEESLRLMLRATHSLKGAARLVEERELERTAHGLEEHLQQIVARAEVTDKDLTVLTTGICALGGATELATQEVKGEVQTATILSGDLLHISSSHAAELITLASELAVLVRKFEEGDSSGVGGKDERIGRARRMRTLAETLERQCYRLRLTPLNEAVKGLPELAQGLAASLGKEVVVRVVNGTTLIDRENLKNLEASFIQLLKNAIDHGIESCEVREKAGKAREGRITITAKQYGALVEIEFADDGAGIDLARLRARVVQRGYHDQASADKLSEEELLEFLFLPGFSTRDETTTLSGRGVGLDIVKATFKEVGGEVSLTHTAGKGTVFSLRVPSRIASFRALLFTCGETQLAVPLSFVDQIVPVAEAATHEVQGRRMFRAESGDMPLFDGRALLGLKPPPQPRAKRHEAIVVLSAMGQHLALVVDALGGEQEIIVQPLDERYRANRRVLGVTDAADGGLVTVLSPEEFLYESLKIGTTQETAEAASESQKDAPLDPILIVDDSLTVRELERRLLLNAGLSCEVAIDGVDALEKLQERSFSMIVTDIDMPRMTGFQLIERVKSVADLQHLPVVVVSYKEREEDRSQAHKLGADAFLSKGSFRNEGFVTTVTELLRRRLV